MTDPASYQMEKPAFFIPTPGQTEQIYLAEYASKNKWADYCLQSDFTLDKVKMNQQLLPKQNSLLFVE